MQKNIGEALKEGSKYLKRFSSNRTEAEVLLSYVLKKSKTDIYRNIFDNIDQSSYLKYKEFLRKRISGEPLCYITGKKEFYGIQLNISKGVLVPRQETELLVEEGINYLKSIKKVEKNVLEIGVGSGAVSIAICKNYQDVFIDAVDISEEAICIARVNISNYSLDNRIRLYLGDLFSPIPRYNKYDLIISNPPYIPEERLKILPIDVKAEPLIALNGGKDGLEILRKIITEGKKYLKNNGLILLEIDGSFQEKKVKELFYANSLRNVFTKKDLAGISRIIGGYLL